MLKNLSLLICFIAFQLEAASVIEAASFVVISIHMRIIGVFAQIIANLSRQDQLDIFQWSIVDQIVQGGAFIHVAGDLVFDGDAIDGENQDFAAADLDAGSVDVVFAGDLLHGILLSML